MANDGANGTLVTFNTPSPPTVTAEMATVTAGGVVTGTAGPAGSGALKGDSDPGGGTLSVTSVTGAGAAQAVTASSTSTTNAASVTGAYGVLTIGADGSYSYLANGQAIVTAPDGPLTDVFTDTVSTSEGASAASSLTITVNRGAGGAETVTNPTGSATYTLGSSTLTINETANTTFTGVIQDGASASGGKVVKVGAAALTLVGQSTYTGGTTISAGVVFATTPSALGTGPVADNGVLDFSGAAGTVANAVSGSGQVNVAGVGAGNTLTFSGALTQTGGLHVQDASSVTLAGSYSGVAAISTTGGAFIILGSASTATAVTNGLAANNGGTVTVGGSGNTTAQLVGGLTGLSQGSASAPLTVNNYGLIEGVQEEGVTNSSPGMLTLTNAGTGVIYGQGLSESSGWGVGSNLTSNVLNVTNQAGGQIVGDGYGVYAKNSADTVVNAGVIAAGTYSGAVGASAIAVGGTDGVALLAGGKLTNQAGGLVEGGTDGVATSSGATLAVSNAGVIAAGTYNSGTQTATGYRAIDAGSGTVKLTNASGGVLASNAQAVQADTITATNLGVISSGTYNTDIDTLSAGTVTLLNAGTITSGNAAAVYAGAAATIVNAAAGQITNTVGAGVYLYGGSVDTYGQIAGGISVGNSGGTLTLRAGSTTGAITAGSANDSVTIYNGAGTASAAATTTYADAVTNAAGTVTLQNAGTLAAASFSTIDLGGGANSISLAGAGDGTEANGTAGTLNLANVLTTGGTNDALYKSGSGVWTLTGAGMFTGATYAQGGVLAVDATAYASAITVSNGATLRGTGTSSAAVSVSMSSTFTPGEGGNGAFTTTAAFALNGGATLAVTAGGGATTSVTAASATLGGALSFTYSGGAETYGTQYDILHLTGASATTTTFLGLAEGATFVSGGQTFQISYTGGASHHDVVLTDVTAGTPTADAQSTAVAFNTAAAVTLTGGDPDSPALPLTYTVATGPAHGTLSGSGADLTYTPAAGYHGADSFTFTDSNGANTSAAATVSLTVATGTPTANAQSTAVGFNTATAVTLTGTDPDSPALSLTYTVAAGPAHGTLSGSGPNLTYTPTAGYHGADSFTFTDSNGANTSAAATVSLTVATGTPNANAQSASVAFNTATTVTLTGGDPDSPALPLTYTIATGPAHGTCRAPAPT